MPKGVMGIPSLELVTLQKVVSNMPKAAGTFFSDMLPTVNYPSDAIEWEIEYGSAGLTPFVAPGAPAPTIGLDGIGSGAARAAYYKEKIFFDESFLNNIRRLGTPAMYDNAERQLAKGLRKIRNRIDRRTEWMAAMAITQGGFTYVGPGNKTFDVSYGIPTTHLVTLTSDYYWDTGGSANIVDDCMGGAQVLREDAGVEVEYAICNSFRLRKLMLNSSIQALLAKSAFGNGDLFSRPAQVIGTLLGVGPLKVYDGFYETECFLTAAVTGGSTTTISVDDASNIEVGSVARFFDVSQANTWEDEVVTAVNKLANTFTCAAPTLSFKANEDKVRIRKKFIDNNIFLLMASKVDGEAIGEFMKAPYGLGRSYGTKMDRWEEKDPDGLWIRVQNKGMPVLQRPDCIYRLQVAATAY